MYEGAMSPNLISLKTYLGKYYPDLIKSANDKKYSNARLARVYEQRFFIQDNKTQMIVDPQLPGLQIIVAGNEIRVSQLLYDNIHIDVTNSIEVQNVNPQDMYNSETFSTIAYLICQNHTMFSINGQLNEPIYIKYRSDFETFYNSVIIFIIQEYVDVEIIEEFESRCALNSVVNYIIQPTASLNLHTFYGNYSSALSFCLRTVIAQENSRYNHVLYGKGSSTVLDENQIYIYDAASVNLDAGINSDNHEFHSIVCIQNDTPDYSFSLNQKHISSSAGKISLLPIVLGAECLDFYANTDLLKVGKIIKASQIAEILYFLKPVSDKAILTSTVGVERFYNNKSKFLQINK